MEKLVVDFEIHLLANQFFFSLRILVQCCYILSCVLAFYSVVADDTDLAK